MKKNIYINSIELAIKNNHKISFNSLKNELLKIGYDKGFVKSDYFKIWFYSNFYQKSIYESIKNGNKSWFQSFARDTNDDESCYLCSEPLTYHQNVYSTKINKRISLIAISISFFLLLINLIKSFTSC